MLEQIPSEARTVEGIRTLMKQLCEALDSLTEGVSLAAPDMVRAILAIRNEIVPVADERLTKCAELIRRGLRDEAVSYAAESPPLVEAATLLDFSGHPRSKIWLAKLTELTIPAPTMPRMDLVAALTLAQDQLDRLKPLLDRWRRMNLANAPLADRIALLGKLRKADPENELWFEVLNEHQKQRIPGLEREVDAATRARDDKRLKALVEEMRGDWIEPVPRRIYSSAKTALERFRGSRINRDLDAVANSLAAAHEARDLAAARTLRSDWQALIDEKGSFSVDDPRFKPALPAVEWVDAHARMETVSEELWNSLDSRPGGLRMRQQWVRSLERLGNEMEDLAEKLEGDADADAIERAHERIGRQRAQLDRDIRFRRMLMYVGIASTAAALGLTVWYFDDRARYDRSVEGALRDLRSAQKNVAGGVLQELPDFERSWAARISSNAEIGSLLAILRGELEQQNSRRKRLADALDKASGNLELAEESKRSSPLDAWPSAFAEASRSLADIDEAALAVTDQEQADAAQIRSSLDRLGKRLVGEADALCRIQIEGFDAELEKARELAALDNVAAAKILEAVRPAIAALREQVAAPAAAEAAVSHSVLRIASEPVVALLAPNGAMLRKAESISGILDSRRKFQQAIEELDRRLGHWPRYVDQLETIARVFGEFPEARDYARAAESKSQWSAVDAWQSFQPWLQRLDGATPDQAQETLTQFESLPAETKRLPMFQQFAQDVMPAVRQLADRDLNKLRTDLESWFSGYWVGELRFVVTTAENVSYYCLEGPQAGDPGFGYVSGRKDPDAGWPTKAERKKVEVVEPSPQSRLADNLRAAVRKTGLKGGIAVDQLFVTLMEALISADDMDAVPRLVTARKLVLLAKEFSRPWRKAGQSLESLLNDGEGGIPGVTIDQLWSFVPPTRERDAEYLVTRQKAQTILTNIGEGLRSVKDAIAKEKIVLAGQPTAQAALVGRLGRNDAGELVAVWQKSAPLTASVWRFPANSAAVVVGEVDNEGLIRFGVNPGPAGTPLFTMTTEATKQANVQQPASGREK